MIIYFANRSMDILGNASTELLKGLTVIEDLKIEDIETGIATFEGYVAFNNTTRELAEKCVKEGNYILRNADDNCEFYTISEVEIDTKKQRVFFYAEDAGLDLINEIVGDFETTEAQPISYYINEFAYDSGFKIGINEVTTFTRKLKWEGEQTATERIASVATQFDGCEIAYRFKFKGLKIVNKYIDIYEKRGKDDGVQLRLNKEVDSILTVRSIHNVATALKCEGGTPDNADNPITLKGYVYDDGDFFVNGDTLYSRNAVAEWGRYVWEDEPNQILGNLGHIVRPFSYDTTSQETLCKRAITELKTLRKAEVNYEVDIKVLPKNTKIGDTVYIVDDAGALYLSTRLLKLEISECDKTIKATLGEFLLKKSGISSKIAKLAADFAKQTVSIKRAESIAKNATALAEAAQQQANEALTESENALKVSDEAKQVVETATQTANDAKTKAEEAENAVNVVEESVSSLETTIENAQHAAQNAQLAADTATEKAEEAKQAAQNAETQANEAKEAVENAENNANSAIEKANNAIDKADEAKELAESASGTAAAAKKDAEKAVEDVENYADNLETYKQTASAEYTRKTEFTETEANLQAQITSNANGIEIVHTKVLTVDETANDAAVQAQAALLTAEQAQAEADNARIAAEQAQAEADNARIAAEQAQAEADIAKQAAETAQSVADKAESDLEKAEEDLATVSSRVDATEEEIAEAQQAIETAQAAVNRANEDLATATETANQAQAEADTALENATNAQNAADYAAKQAGIAQQVAEIVGSSAASQAIKKADDAQNTANTAKTNAENAQSVADQAAADALKAQQTADDAEAKVNQAEIDLATAEQNLINVTSKVDATEAEVEAAKEAVNVAQQAADKAKQEAEAAQSTADKAKEDAEKAQQAADEAKTAADNAQQVADEAKQAADKAQSDVNALAVRVTKTETDFVKTNEQIGLLATKDEVSQTLGGYYTKSEADAAILAKANEINLSVDSKVSGVQIGSRNLVRDSSMSALTDMWIFPENTTYCFENGYCEIYRDTTTGTGIYNRQTSDLNKLLKPDKIAGSTFTLSAEIKLLDGYEVSDVSCLYYRCGTSELSDGFEQMSVGFGSATNQWQKIFTTFTFGDYDFDGYCRVGFVLENAVNVGICIRNIKLEKGNKATDWSPAPEDIDDKFSNYSTTEEMHRAIELNEEGIFSTVKDTYTSKEDFNNLDVGGRNLVRDSSMSALTDMWIFSPEYSTYCFENGYCEIYKDTTIGIFNRQTSDMNKLLKPDKIAGSTFTLSAEIKLLDGYEVSDVSCLYYRCGTSELSNGFEQMSVGFGSATNQWQKIFTTFTFGDYDFDGYCQVGFVLESPHDVGICIRNIKLEKGNKATDWSPAPEDAESDIDNLQDTASEYSGLDKRIEVAESSIKQLSDTISTLIQKKAFYKVNYENGVFELTEEGLEPLNGNPVGVLDTGGTVYLGTDRNGEEIYFYVDEKASQMVFDTEKSIWSFNTSEIDENISQHKADIKDLKDKSDGTAQNVSNIDERLKTFEEHIAISTYEDEPCISLYEEDSNYKKIITNTREILVKKVDDGEETSIIQDLESMRSKKFIASENLQIGGYVLKNLDNGAIVLTWEGVTE